MGYMIILPVPFDILDAAIAENLTYLPRGFVENEREPITSASVIYHLTQEQLGEVGELRVRKLLQNKSELYLCDPASPKTRHPTEEELTLVRSKSNRDEKVAAMSEINTVINKERDDLH